MILNVEEDNNVKGNKARRNVAREERKQRKTHRDEPHEEGQGEAAELKARKSDSKMVPRNVPKRLKQRQELVDQVFLDGVGAEVRLRRVWLQHQHLREHRVKDRIILHEAGRGAESVNKHEQH